MRIRMLKTESGSVDGIRVKSYEKDSEYALTSTDGERSLASAFVGAGFALNLDGDAKGTVAEPAHFPPASVESESQAASAEPAQVPPATKPGRTKKQ